MKESQFQSKLVKRLKLIFPGCIVLKNDARLMQGIPDLSVFYKDKWAMLECKASANEHHQPGQDAYIDILNSMSIAFFIYPENEEEVINELRKYFGV